MRRVSVLLVAAALLSPAAANAAGSPQRTLTRALSRGTRSAGSSSGAYVVDLSTGQTLYSYKSSVGRLPASVEKLYTTTTALIRFGPNGTFQTRIYGVGSLDSTGTWHGTLYLRGGGDPTFGAQGFDRYYYGAGATMQRLVANLVRTTPIKALAGPHRRRRALLRLAAWNHREPVRTLGLRRGPTQWARVRPWFHRHPRIDVPDSPRIVRRATVRRSAASCARPHPQGHADQRRHDTGRCEVS